MEFVIVTIKSQGSDSPILMTCDAEEMVYLQLDDASLYLSTIEPTLDEPLPGFGNHMGNVIFLFGHELALDQTLSDATQTGIVNFKEPENWTRVETRWTKFHNYRIATLCFEDEKTAKRFVEKKIFGELYLTASAEQDRFPFYPLLKEAYLFSSSEVEICLIGLADCQNTLTVPGAQVDEMNVTPADKIMLPIENTDGELELRIWKKYNVEFTPGSGLNLAKMSRGKTSVVDSEGNVRWQIHDEVFKFYVA